MRRQFLRAMWLSAMACAIAAASVPGTARQPYGLPSARQASDPTLSPASEKEIAKLAEKLVPEIRRRNLGKIGVFGAADPGELPTFLGKAIGDSFSEALARQAQGFSVMDRDELRAIATKLHVSADMLVENSLVDWLSSQVQLGGAVSLNFTGGAGGSTMVEADLFDFRKGEGGVVFRQDTHISVHAPHDDPKMKSLNSDGRFLDPNSSDPPAEDVGISNPTCIFCPSPEFSEQARKAGLGGDVLLAGTVLPDGALDDVNVLRPLGLGLDAKAVEAALRWKFNPGLNTNGSPARKRVKFQVSFKFKTASGASVSSLPSKQRDDSNEIPMKILRMNGTDKSADPPPDLTNYPACIYCPRPDYPVEAKKKKIQGDVWLEALVTTEGIATDIGITKTLGYGLDEEAVRAVKEWKFRPALDPAGKPMDKWTQIQIQFQLF
jgi:TonB family protein